MIEKKEAPVIGQEAVQYQNLRLGSQGEDVKKLQTALGFTGPDVDGIYGKKTLQAVLNFQRKNDLDPDGVAGQQTQTALYKNAGASGDATVDQAQQILNQNLGSGSYTPVWADAAQQYLEQYQGRDPFSYDFATDALYQQMADQYAKGAKLSMMDTMGQAAAMTGGYGSTWAQHVGQQAYDQTMSQLTGIIPELEQRAFDRYQQEGNDLLTQYDLYRGLEDQEYARWRDAVADYQWQQSFDESNRQFEKQYALSAANGYGGGGGGGDTPYTMSFDESEKWESRWESKRDAKGNIPKEAADFIRKQMIDAGVPKDIAFDWYYRYMEGPTAGGGTMSNTGLVGRQNYVLN